MDLFRFNVLLLLSSLLAGALVGVGLPRWRDALILEDGVVESLGAGAFLAAAVVGAVGLVRGGRLRRARSLLAGFCALGFLDELSWGERALGVRMPEAAGVKLDALHDLGDLLQKSFARWPLEVAVAAIALSALLAPAIRLGWRRRYRLAEAIGWSGIGPTTRRLLALAAALLIAAALIDLAHIPYLAATALEEMLETNAAFACVSAQWSLRRDERLAS